MAKFVYTGEEYINADHIVFIDVPSEDNTIDIILDTGLRFSRDAKYLTEILRFINYDK